ncbi:MAG: NUDIX hydrolase [Candidatus Methanoperedens sp.]
MNRIQSNGGKIKNVLTPLNKEDILYRGKIFEIVKQYWKLNGANKTEITEREIARRSPGVRVILNNNDKILMIKEYRTEYEGWDYRLPGGKVFDTLEEYTKVLNEDILRYATEAAKKELLEETGLIANDIKYLCETKAGATVIWDLYYFEVNNFETSITGQNLENGEIINIDWKNIQQVKQMCLDGIIKEDRTIGVLLKYLISKEMRTD